MRLGESFIRSGVITQAQLDEALHAQLIYGGHLGTCLMELGHVDEFQLGRALADLFAVPCASTDLLRKVRLPVVKSTPAKLVERHQAVPLELRGKTLRIAMVNPKDLQAHDELSFATGCRMEPWVAPEARILQAMERYYDIPRRPRYVALCRRLDGDWINRRQKPSGAGSRPRRSTMYQGSPYMESLKQGGRERRVSRPRGSARKATAVPKADAGYDAACAASPINWSTVSDTAPRNSEDDISELLCRAETVESVADAVLNHTSRRLARCVLFTVQSTTAEIWGYRGFWVDQDRARKLSFSITAEPIFQLFLGDGYYQGPLPDDPRYRGFYDRLQIPVPSEIMIVPVHLDDRLVALFYGDGRRSTDMEEGVEPYRLLLRKLSLALDLVTLKRKIRLL